ncbi:MAG: hypothetical protein K6G26_09370 [Lachnospiraceae bacterium]|nr:hypothetical protein [Lachnospiraceae bacterium]
MENEVKSVKRDLSVCLYMMKKNRQRIVLNVILFLIIGIVCAVIISYTKEDEYMASATIYSSEYGSYEKSVEGITAVKDYSDIMSSTKVCSRAISIMGYEPMSIEDMKDAIKVYSDKEKNIVMLTVVANSEEDAIAMTNAVAQAFVSEIRNITGIEAAQMLDEADRAYSHSSVKKTMVFVIILFGFLGGIGTCAIVFIKTLTSQKILEVNECSLDGTLEIIGILPDFNIMS